MSNTYKLTYFNFEGRGETPRLIFAAGGLQFEDNRNDAEAWVALKPNTPFGNIPILEVNGKVVFGQSMAIARFVARETGLAGETSIDQAIVDSIADTINELRENLFNRYMIKDAAQQEAAMNEFPTTAPPMLEKINKFLAANNGGTGFLVGSALTWADLHLYATIAAMKDLSPTSSEEIAKFPLLTDLFARVGAIPKVAEYLKKRLEVEG